MAPQKNVDVDVALNTIFHEMSRTMDDKIGDAVDTATKKQGVNPSTDLAPAVTLYTTTEITKRLLSKAGRSTTRWDEDRTALFERSAWTKTLAALQKDWQPYLEQKAPFEDAINKLVRDSQQ